MGTNRAATIDHPDGVDHDLCARVTKVRSKGGRPRPSEDAPAEGGEEEPEAAAE